MIRAGREYDPRFGPEFQLRVAKLDPSKDLPEQVLFKLTEARREVAVLGQGKGDMGAALSVSERKLKGVTVFDVLFEKTEGAPGANQLWTVTEVK